MQLGLSRSPLLPALPDSARLTLAPRLVSRELPVDPHYMPPLPTPTGLMESVRRTSIALAALLFLWGQLIAQTHPAAQHDAGHAAVKHLRADASIRQSWILHGLTGALQRLEQQGRFPIFVGCFLSR